MSADSSKKNDVIFFFGAGASVDAGIPDTVAFAKEFEEYIKTDYPKLSPTLSKILEKRKKFNEKDSDLRKTEI